MKILTGHMSPETAYVSDGHYWNIAGKTVTARYWVERKTRHGFRLCYQTRHPDTGRWNKVHCTAYDVLMTLYLDDDGNVNWEGLRHDCTDDQADAYAQKFKLRGRARWRAL